MVDNPSGKGRRLCENCMRIQSLNMPCQPWRCARRMRRTCSYLKEEEKASNLSQTTVNIGAAQSWRNLPQRSSSTELPMPGGTSYNFRFHLFFVHVGASRRMNCWFHVVFLALFKKQWQMFNDVPFLFCNSRTIKLVSPLLGQS